MGYAAEMYRRYWRQLMDCDTAMSVYDLRLQMWNDHRASRLDTEDFLLFQEAVADFMRKKERTG